MQKINRKFIIFFLTIAFISWAKSFFKDYNRKELEYILKKPYTELIELKYKILNNEKLKNQAKEHKEIEEEIEREYSELYYDLENPYIKMNPYKHNPLSGIIKFQTEKPSKIKLILKSKTSFGNDYVQKFEEFEIEHKIEIRYLYLDNNNILELISEDMNGEVQKKEILIKTENLKSKYPIIKVNQTNNRKEFLLLEYGVHGDGKLPFAIDALGNIRGGLEVENYYANILINNNKNLVWAKENKIYEYTILGKLVKVIDMDIYSAHHDIQQKIDGNYLVTVHKKGSILEQNNKKILTVEDYIIEITPEGKVVKEWDFKNIMDTERKVIAGMKKDWIHINSVFYDEEKNEIIVSGNFQGVFSVDYEDNLKWILSDPTGYNERFKDKLLTKDEVNIDFRFPYGQHQATKLENGNILAFDNNVIHFDWGSGLDLKKLIPENNEYSRVVEYRVDSENMKVYQEWEYVDKNLFSDVISGVRRYGQDHLITYGYLKDQNSNRYGKIRKINKDKEIEYDFDIFYRTDNSASLYRSQILNLD